MPGASPTTTNAVFFDTADEALPPRARIASLAWSRLNRVSDPVTTMAIPSSVRGTSGSSSSASRTPAARHRSTIERCQSTANQSTIASAMVGPTPSVPARASRSADSMASIERKCWASDRAAVGPTCRIDSATRTRHSGRSLAPARFASSRVPFADSPPSLRRNSGTCSSAASSSPNRSPSSTSTPEVSRAVAAS